MFNNSTWTFVFFGLNFILAFFLIFLERKNPQTTLAWLLVLFFLPNIGFILYILLSRNLSITKMFKLQEAHAKLYIEIVNDQIKKLKEGNFKIAQPVAKKHLSLLKFNEINGKTFYTEDNKIQTYFSGKQKFTELLKTMDNANESIHMQYYIIMNDSISKMIINMLTKKAKQGIKVRLLYDSYGSMMLNRKLLKPLLNAGGEISSFFPISLNILDQKPNYRNHRKLVIVDSKYGFIGGFNVGDEYLGLNKKRGNWRDTHLKIEGSAVNSLQLRFILDWEYSSKKKVNLNTAFKIPEKKIGNSGIQIISSGPDGAEEEIKQSFFKMITSAKNSIYIQTPYFIPDESMIEALKIAALSGINIQIMIPNKPDNKFVYLATLSFAGELLKYGINILAYNNGFLHAKTIIIDEEVSSVGTANFDIRSFKLNFEVNAFIYDKKVTKKLCKKFKEDINYCIPITIEQFKSRSLIQKIEESICRLFSPIM